MTNPLNHQCVNGRHCQPGDNPRETDTPMCEPCQQRAGTHIRRLPDQYERLQTMIGEHPTNPEGAGRRTKPDSAVLINTAVDTLCGNIAHYAGLGAEVIADALRMADDPRYVFDCCALIYPHLARLLAVVELDVMVWDAAGSARIITTTTGPAIIQQLDHLAMTAHYTLGMTRARSYRDLPCARCNQRTVGRWAGADSFDCETCGALFRESDIRHRDRILLERHRRGLIHA